MILVEENYVFRVFECFCSWGPPFIKHARARVMGRHSFPHTDWYLLIAGYNRISHQVSAYVRKLERQIEVQGFIVMTLTTFFWGGCCIWWMRLLSVILYVPQVRSHAAAANIKWRVQKKQEYYLENCYWWGLWWGKIIISAPAVPPLSE